MPHRVLIVDDDSVMLDALRQLLATRLTDVSMDVASSAKTALQQIAGTDYDAIVSDIKMPGTDGLVLMRQILQIRPTTPTLLITGHGDRELGVNALNAGAYAFIQKPIDREYFLAWLRRAIQLRQLNRQVEEQNRRLERAIEERTTELRQALEFGEAVMASMGEGLYALNQEGLVRYINPAAEEILGWEKDELIGRKMHDVIHYRHPDGRPHPAQDCPGLQVLQEGKVLRAMTDTFIRRDGSFFKVIYSSAPLKSHEQIAGVVVVFRDV